jgi:ABC-type phosphate transport system substrate-binding protein
LILILVAVAAAAALYLWLVAYQGGVTKQIGNSQVQYSLTIGGSTTVYPLDQQAVQYFEQNNTNVVVSNVPGGSGAGLLAVCSGAIDMAAMSRPMKAAELTLCPTAVQKVLGYDAVSVNAAVGNNGGFTATSSMGEGELLAIYWLNGGQPSTASGFPIGLGAVGTPFAGLTGTVANTGVPGYWGIKAPAGANGPAGVATLQWAQIPTGACFDPTATVSAAGFWTAAGTTCTAYTYPASTNVVHVYARADNSGTEEAFDNNVLGISCGTDNQLASCGFPTSTTLKSANTINVATGNAAVLTAIVADKDALGFNSWGLSTAPLAQGGGAAGTGAAIVVDMGVLGNTQTGAVSVSLATIKTGIAAGYGIQVAGGYIGWRPLQYVTLGAAAGESERFIQFVLQPSVDQTLCTQNYFISVYA